MKARIGSLGRVEEISGVWVALLDFAESIKVNRHYDATRTSSDAPSIGARKEQKRKLG